LRIRGPGMLHVGRDGIFEDGDHEPPLAVDARTPADAIEVLRCEEGVRLEHGSGSLVEVISVPYHGRNVTTVARRDRASGRAKSRSGPHLPQRRRRADTFRSARGRIVSTGIGACRTTFSATLPRRRCGRPVRPSVLITIAVAPRAALMMHWYGSPVT